MEGWRVEKYIFFGAAPTHNTNHNSAQYGVILNFFFAPGVRLAYAHVRPMGASCAPM